MLKELYIKNLAVISEAVIPFCDSFNAFTGETGAGKSILINGINAVLGQRVTKDIVRSGCDKAVITALFTGLSENVIKKLDELGIAHDDDEISVTREIMADGGSVARINSRTATVSVLREIGETLVNIHGQHDNQILLAPEKHLGILDSYGDLDDMVEDYKASFTKLQETSRRLKKLTSEERERAERAELMKIRIDEIGNAAPEENEDELLEKEYKAAANSFDIAQALSAAYHVIDGDEDTAGASEMISGIINELSPYSDMVQNIENVIGRLSGLKAELDDISSELMKECDNIDTDPARLAQISARLDLLRDLKRKYGPTLADVMDTYHNAVREAEAFESSGELIRETAGEREKLLAQVSDKAKKLSAARREAGERFVRQIEEELAFLDMPNVKLSVESRQGKLTGNGMDTVEFLISTNKGEGMKPLSKIASGGELSRIMLALKNVIADKDDIHTLIFDEIDTGVSGRAAQKIGIKLRQVSSARQVLCVTHLSQLAVMADNHLLIEKKTEGDRTFTSVRQLDFEERKYEIARIMCGDNITDTALKNAEELLKSR
ncbi:MAG: DNA repair protein RecN [Oscillospiraceae bacterium]|nr:DNA repair protein RecN [Oscillospiraceae bacterium]